MFGHLSKKLGSILTTMRKKLHMKWSEILKPGLDKAKKGNKLEIVYKNAE